MMQCEVTKDIPADDELVAMLTVSEAAAAAASISASVVTDSEASPAAASTTAAAKTQEQSPRPPSHDNSIGGRASVEVRLL